MLMVKTQVPLSRGPHARVCPACLHSPWIRSVVHADGAIVHGGKWRTLVVACVVPAEGVDESAVTAIDLPRTIHRRDGQCAPVTLWASSDKRLRFAN